MGNNRLIKRILDIDIKLIKEVDISKRIELEKQRYDLVEKLIKIKTKEYE
jgi:hypothetical protein